MIHLIDGAPDPGREHREDRCTVWGYPRAPRGAASREPTTGAGLSRFRVTVPRLGGVSHLICMHRPVSGSEGGGGGGRSS
ncbi:hypothetical protein PBY51_004597 [Eleginops maclovinus]|uniref:Uncharacterized protein n=1 Tax=Eleginops maclovinus TaxID=56733 RepID=A0AAN8AQT4_ELEMC|nr:hypothetical protein PBY51_004597 [Eleginops maclovinus]